MEDAITERFVDSADGVRIAVYEQGNPDGPTLVMAHGWPDSHVLWDGVVPLLADRFRIIRYDNRGVGKSSVPKPVSAYTMAKLADDFARGDRRRQPRRARARAGPRLGSVATWEYLSRPGASDRVASFTSVSGPGIAHYGGYIFDSLKRPYRPVRFVRALDRLLRLTYWYPFAVPVRRACGVQGACCGAAANRLLTDRRARRAALPQRHRGRRPRQLAEDLSRARRLAADAGSPPTATSACRCS